MQIYGLSSKGKRFVFGKLEGGVLRRNVKGLLNYPFPKIALDAKCLLEVHQLGAKTIEATYRGDVYTVSVGMALEAPRRDRGAGLQAEVPISAWAKQAEPELQPALFEIAST